MNKMKNIYGGFNPIFENMSNSLKEEKDKGGSKTPIKGMDVVSAVSTALNTVFSILMSSKNESAKTVRGFEEIKNKIIGSNNFGSFRQYLVSLVQSFGALDSQQRDAYEKNVKYIVDLLSGNTESTLSDPKIYDSLRKDIITKLLINFSNDLKERETQFKKTNPKLFGEVVKQGLVVKENQKIIEKKKSGDETDVEDAEFRGIAFNKSKESLDAANSFVGMIDRDKYVPVLKDNDDIKRYKEIADGLYKKAQDLQMTDRKGIVGRKIVTSSGEYKTNEYKRTQDDLLNEIIRQKKEYIRIKDGILKNNNIKPAPAVIPVCPPGKKYDESKGICVDVVSAKDDEKPGPVPVPKPKPKPSKVCEFPVKLGTRCNEVGTIQSKLMEILPSVAEYLPKSGGADSRYGSSTAKCVNIVWAYMSKNTLSLDGDLTKEMYDAILLLTSSDVDLDCGRYPKTYQETGVKENRNWEMSITEKIKEIEEYKNASLLSFEDFYSVIEEAYKFNKLDEQTDTNVQSATTINITNKKLIDCCVKESIAGNFLKDCVGASGASGETGPTGDNEWVGLKPVEDGAYTILYDESWSNWWSDFAKGALITGLIIGGAILTGGIVAAVAPLGAGFAGGAAAVATAGGLLSTGGSALAITVGVVGGASLIKWAGNDRKPCTVLVYNGFIESVAVKAMARGLYNSMGGTISSQDMLAIYSTLILCRGTFTDNGDGKAISVWGRIQKEFSGFGGGNLVQEIGEIITTEGFSGFFKDIVTQMGDIPSFPRSFKTKDPSVGGDSITFEGAKDACLDGIRKLGKNEAKLKENLSKITEKDLEALSEGMEEITEQVDGKMSGDSEED